MIDRRVVNLNKFSPDWVLPPLREFIRKVPLFDMMTDEEIELLVKSAEEQIFRKDDYITKEGERAHGVFVLSRGGCVITSNLSNVGYREKGGVGSVVTFHQIISHQARYISTCQASCMVYALFFPMFLLKKIVEGRPELEEFVWRESIFPMSRLFPKELKSFSMLDKDDLTDIFHQAIFKVCRKNTSINVPAALILRGEVLVRKILSKNTEEKRSERFSTSEQNLVYPPDESPRLSSMKGEKPTTAEENMTYRGLCLILPPENAKEIELVCLKKTRMFSLEKIDDLREFLTGEFMGRVEKKLSTLRGLRPKFHGSMKRTTSHMHLLPSPADKRSAKSELRPDISPGLRALREKGETPSVPFFGAKEAQDQVEEKETK
eukprot:TRINITY_DN4677_c0_g1_i1.p1 TRINITY_DN4677_c0_g1~~TRINITY_DN4677_c0_g1_i1.p1  ORF type:complete len:377 (-),score=90.58 TRINITY_DN4677_c0_g1_i1:231-1361(-)